MTLSIQLEVALPDWLEPFIKAWGEPLDTVEHRMRLAIALSAESIAQGTGGPFGAVVIDMSSDRLIGVGVNLVTSLDLSIAHAEIVALSLAQHKRRDWNLGRDGAVQLVTSCEPCAMCFGAVPWSGVNSLICGARKEDAESAGFDEGDKPGNWAEALEKRGIKVVTDVLRDEAAAVLSDYARTEGAIYHPGQI
jgi:tRNA(Arg) A34 adenosine deaminase TadA